ncbi:MAG: 4-hydroxy-tetrahydrodipicolinate reductase [Clostridia bacterium]|nr:4-hydroxy-tetrahydrodipicolinate reductase [Clostridia bacterium]
MNIIIHGATGKMGKAMTAALLEKRPDVRIIPVAIDLENGYRHLCECKEEAACIIDFSNHAATAKLLDYATSLRIPVVIATTGQTEEELALIQKAAETIPVFYSSNMSVGIAVLAKMAKQAVKAFPAADIEIVEVHHNQKVDAPSGTAITLAKSISEVLPDSVIHSGRTGYGKRAPNEIGISSLRMGNVVGIHEIHICTPTQTLVLKHEAHDRKLFAEGALSAMEYLIGKAAGYYTMETMLEG